MSKIAIKRLTASDLTLFKWHFENLNAGNQKAINLNKNVFVDELFPSLPAVVEEEGWRFSIDLYLYGPGLSGEYNLQRKILKGETYKNWRLDGEFIVNPQDDPQRFNDLRPDDFVVIEFSGHLKPVSAKMIFIAQTVEQDTGLHTELQNFMNDRPMAALEPGELEQVIQNAESAAEHPIHDFVMFEVMVDAAQGGIEGINRLRSRPTYRRMTRRSLEDARTRAGNIGFQGEELINTFLTMLQENAEIQSFEWTSFENAISPFDFSVTQNDGSVVLVDVKSTSGRFENRIHISYNELLQISSEEFRYDIYRVYELNDGGAVLRISRNLNDFGRSVVTALQTLPEGVHPDGVSISSTVLEFEEEIELTPPDNE
ncbi:MAG: DUF3883 domain-containing protein [Chloroflexi bacterium]|nr:MAG: DUF3883 domain-containing protein [Chloroflexota bacterium]MBL1196928.1 DUF3883 domain-containing protein [Chloroflexota bacterium]NOH14224.1 DUF3883 domain-containing protein [Chloroflexota bacterium]